jgi:hypothetical protein
MLDPLTALSLAGNIIHIVDFSSKLVNKGREIYRAVDGALSENLEIEIVAKDLTTLVQKLMNHTGSDGHTSVSSTDLADSELHQICENCKSISTKLLAKLQEIKVKGKHRQWKSFRQALKSVWTKDEIDGLARRLAVFRNQLQFHIMVSYA